MIGEFVKPYIQMFYGAGFNIQQTLEGYGLSSSNFIEVDSAGQITGSYWSPSQASVIPALMLTAYFLLVLLPLALSAGYVLNRTKGAILALFFLSMPGLLNMAGFWPDIRFTPERFVLDGRGIMGEVTGYLPLLVIGLITGWCVTIVIYDSLKLSDKFRNTYDHLWYCSAVAAGVFFIVDSGRNLHNAELAEENKYGSQASSYLAKQLKEYRRFCLREGKADSASCTWASNVQQKLTDYSYYNAPLYVQLGPRSTSELYLPYAIGAEPLKIREEIRAYNESKCSTQRRPGSHSASSESSITCETVPANFCRAFPEPPKGFVDQTYIIQPVAVASECILPTLVRSRDIQESLIKKVEDGSRDQHLKWLYFLMFSLIAGGKIANASTKLVSMDSRPTHERRRLIRLCGRMLGSVLVLNQYLVASVCLAYRKTRAFLPT